MALPNQAERYLILDCGYTPIARGELLSRPDHAQIRLKVLEHKADLVAAQTTFQLVSMADHDSSMLVEFIRKDEDCLIVQPLRYLGSEVRQNLRMPTDFFTYIYPTTRDWRGRHTVQVRDLSCGGVSLYSSMQLEEGEQLEVVIPLMEPPLILPCRVVRRDSAQGRDLYALSFVGLCGEEEALVRKAVFNIQLRGQSRSTTLLKTSERM